MDETITYNVRVYKTQVYRGVRVTTYYQRKKKLSSGTGRVLR